MTRSGSALSGFIILFLLTGPAMAQGSRPGSGGLPPLTSPQAQMQRQMMTAPPARGPYPLTYSEQVAQSLGVTRNGFSLYESRDAARNPYAPSISVGGGGMLRLRWNQ